MDNQNNIHIFKAWETVDNLISLANNADVLRNDHVRSILLGVLQHCAYKIRLQAHKAKGRSSLHIFKMHEGQSFNLGNSIMILGAVLILGAAVVTPANATVITSTEATEVLGGLNFGKGDLADYDQTTDIAVLFFDGGLFGGPSDIDAAHVLDNGNIILSTALNATLGGLSFGDGDLIEYDPTTDIATLFLSESLFGTGANIDAIHILDSGNIILSTGSSASLGGLSFADGDLIEYNPTTDIATLFFSESLFGNNENIDAAHILENGNIILSTSGAASLGGLGFADGDLIEYNPLADVATVFFNENLFATNANIDAAYVTPAPEPATIALLGLSSLILIHQRRK